MERQMEDYRDRLLTLLKEKAYKEGEFELSSGRRSNYYLDCKQVTLAPEGVGLVGRAFYEIIKQYEVSAVGGLNMGADPIATATTDAAYRDGKRIPAFIARKDTKEHGLQKWVEGPLVAGSRVAIVDDVVTSGGSILKATRIVEEERDCDVAVLVTLVDRLEGGRKKIEGKGYEFRSVFTIEDLHSTPNRRQDKVLQPSG